MTVKRLICIILGVIFLLAACGYLLFLMPKTAAEDQEMMSGATETETISETPAVETAVQTETPEPTPTSDLPDVDINSWELTLVNADNPIGEYVPEVSEIEGIPLDSRIIEPMQEFISAARAEGLSVLLSSGYRSYDEQSYLYNRKVEQYGDAEVAASIVARPGTSEHQTGLACDITDQYYELKNSSLEDTALFQWMSQHCQEYGFIVRFPKDKEEITGIIYEPWHFRYVGKEVAQYMVEHNLCLEEFVELYK